MRPLLNTLFVTTQGSYLAREGECVLIRVEQENRLRVPIHTLNGIVCFGQVSCSPPLMDLCAERDVALSFLTEHGQFLARMTGPARGNVLLRRQQYRMADDAKPIAAVARSAVLGKVANCRTVLMRASRERAEADGAGRLVSATAELARLLGVIERTTDVEALRGLEGDAARVYFSTFDNLILVSKDAFYFRERSRRPPSASRKSLPIRLWTSEYLWAFCPTFKRFCSRVSFAVTWTLIRLTS